MNRFAAALAAVFTLAAPTLAEDVTITTARGEVTLPVAPARVVALDVAAIDTLGALGVPLAGMPDNLYVPGMDAGGAEAVGTLFEPDLEKLAGIAPDLIIVGSRSATQLDAVSQVAPAVDMTIGPDLVAEAGARLTAYGTLFQKPEEAATLKAGLDDKLAALKAAADGKGSALILMTNGNKIAAYGTGSRFGWLHEQTGMPPAIDGLDADEGHGNALSFEAIAEANPDWLFVLDRGVAVGEEGASAAQTLASPLVERTTAWQKDQVVYLPAAELYIAGGGYTALGKVVDALTEALSQ